MTWRLIGYFAQMVGKSVILKVNLTLVFSLFLELENKESVQCLLIYFFNLFTNYSLIKLYQNFIIKQKVVDKWMINLSKNIWLSSRSTNGFTRPNLVLKVECLLIFELQSGLPRNILLPTIMRTLQFFSFSSLVSTKSKIQL